MKVTHCGSGPMPPRMPKMVWMKNGGFTRPGALNGGQHLAVKWLTNDRFGGSMMSTVNL